MLRDALQVEEEARLARAGAGKLGGTRGGSGGGGATWRSRERASAGWGAVRGAGVARGAEKSGAGQLELGKSAGESGGVRRRENRERRGWR
jgi:hypothetical protein